MVTIHLSGLILLTISMIMFGWFAYTAWAKPDVIEHISIYKPSNPDKKIDGYHWTVWNARFGGTFAFIFLLLVEAMMIVNMILGAKVQW